MLQSLFVLALTCGAARAVMLRGSEVLQPSYSINRESQFAKKQSFLKMNKNNEMSVVELDKDSFLHYTRDEQDESYLQSAGGEPAVELAIRLDWGVDREKAKRAAAALETLTATNALAKYVLKELRTFSDPDIRMAIKQIKDLVPKDERLQWKRYVIGRLHDLRGMIENEM